MTAYEIYLILLGYVSKMEDNEYLISLLTQLYKMAVRNEGEKNEYWIRRIIRFRK